MRRLNSRIASIKQSPDAATISWYRYDSFSVLPVFQQLLSNPSRSIADLAGSSCPVLDVGCGDGQLSFLFESLGYPVVAVDNVNTNCNRMQGVHYLKSRLHSGIEIHSIDIDNSATLPDVSFRLVLFFGVLYHLKNPFQALENLARRASHCVMSTRIAAYTPDVAVAIKDYPLAYLVGQNELNGDSTNYWIFSETALLRLLDRAGWDVLRTQKTGCQTKSTPSSQEADERMFVLMRSRLSPVKFDLGYGWHSLENGHARWTERVFSLSAERPQGASRFRFRFFLPPSSLDQTGPLTLSVRASGHDCGAQVFSFSGDQVFEGEIPDGIGDQPIDFSFSLDHCLPPGDKDHRELGVLVSFGAGNPPVTLW